MTTSNGEPTPPVWVGMLGLPALIVLFSWTLVHVGWMVLPVWLIAGLVIGYVRHRF